MFEADNINRLRVVVLWRYKLSHFNQIFMKHSLMVFSEQHMFTILKLLTVLSFISWEFDRSPSQVRVTSQVRVNFFFSHFFSNNIV